MNSLSTIVAGSAASILMLNAATLAQQPSQQHQQYQQSQQTQQLTNREVREFASKVERDINDMVQTRNLSRLSQWTQNHIADNAVFSQTNSIEEGESRVISSRTVTKPDLLRFQHFALSGMSEKLNSVEDFRLDIRVVNVHPVGESAALVKSRVSERATLTPRQGETGGRVGRQRESTSGQAPRVQPGENDEDSQQRGRSTRGQQAGLQLESEATCDHLIERNRDTGRLQIAMGICDSQTNAQF